jgi:hypothetical protein
MEIEKNIQRSLLDLLRDILNALECDPGTNWSQKIFSAWRIEKQNYTLGEVAEFGEDSRLARAESPTNSYEESICDPSHD